MSAHRNTIRLYRPDGRNGDACAVCAGIGQVRQTVHDPACIRGYRDAECPACQGDGLRSGDDADTVRIFRADLVNGPPCTACTGLGLAGMSLVLDGIERQEMLVCFDCCGTGLAT